MPLHFDRREFRRRQAAAVGALRDRGLDGLLMFRQESMYYLTGYDSFAYVVFQCLYLDADGSMTLLVRPPDTYVARYTSTIKDIRVWRDGIDDPVRMLRDILAERQCRGSKLGVEFDAFGLRGHDALKLSGLLREFCTLQDASDIVSRLRAIKSDSEIKFVSRAAKLADAAFEKGYERLKAGAFEGEILAAMQAEILRQDGDYPANEFVIGSGPAALLGRYTSGRRHLNAGDLVTIELAGVFRHYHACLERNVCLGKASARLRTLYDVALDAMQAAMDAMRPGNTNGMVYDAYARVCARAGLAAGHSACGYGLGATFAPSWMDGPFLRAHGEYVLQPDMVFFLQAILFDADEGLIACPGHTVRTTGQACESLCGSSLELLVR